MKRDLELIKKILFEIEDSELYGQLELSIDGYDNDYLNYHLLLLKEAGFIDAQIDIDESEYIVNAYPIRITWSGYEFLDLARNEKIWTKSKKFISEKSVSVSIAIFTEVMKYFVKSLLLPEN